MPHSFSLPRLSLASASSFASRLSLSMSRAVCLAVRGRSMPARVPFGIPHPISEFSQNAYLNLAPENVGTFREQTKRAVEAALVEHAAKALYVGRGHDVSPSLSRSRSRITVAGYHLPPAAVAILRAFNSAAALVADRLASSASTGRMRSANSSALRCASSEPTVQPPSALLGDRKPFLGVLADKGALLLGESGKQMQDERIGIGAKLGDDERHLMRHQPGNEMHITREPVEL